MKLELYNYLTAYGSCYEIKKYMLDSKKFVNWTEENFSYVRYNPRKEIAREGLSITSLDGGLSGRPDLDSLLEYNIEHNTKYMERDFSVKTPVFEYPSLKAILEPIESHIFRSHVLKLNNAGYFPPHRDFYGMHIDSFRLIIPLMNCSPPLFTFMHEDKVIHWTEGRVYFLDTAKMHYLFNMHPKPVYMVVINVDLNVETVKYVTEDLRYQ
jgi:hypothetical protein